MHKRMPSYFKMAALMAVMLLRREASSLQPLPTPLPLLVTPSASFVSPSTTHAHVRRYSGSTVLFGRRGGDKSRVKNRGGKNVKKSDLPSKVCVVCGRPFTWRKKWERCWDEVQCCSKSCNAKRRSSR